MRYLSLDIETTGVNPDRDQILQVSAIIDDTTKPEIPVEELNHFTCFIRRPEYTGNAYALNMNSWILALLSGRSKEAPKYAIHDSEVFDDNHTEWVINMNEWLKENFPSGKIVVAGKNVAGFDIPFMPSLIRSKFAHRTIDPTMLWTDWANDLIPPDLKLCKQRAGINTPVAHDAREDAMDVIRLLRRSIGGPIA